MRYRLWPLFGKREPTNSLVDSEVRAAAYPPSFPRGFYRLCDADELPPGRVLGVRTAGQALAVFRTEAGELGAVDAHCPHQGADLSQGRVCEGTLECPFHLWRFGVDGQVRHIPYADKGLPRTLRTRTWPVQEWGGMVLAYVDPEGPPAEPPYWLEPPEGFDQMRHLGEYDAGVIRMHLVEFAENSVDFRHFAPLHGDMLLPWTSLRVPGVQIRHHPQWSQDPDRPHMAYFDDYAELDLFGKHVEGAGAHATISLYGPGGVVAFRFRIPGKGHVLLFQTHTPISGMEQHVRFRWYADPSVSRWLASYMVGNWVSQWGADLRIWEAKVYRQRPMLVDGDGPVHRMRRWYAQFYASSAPATP